MSSKLPGHAYTCQLNSSYAMESGISPSSLYPYVGVESDTCSIANSTQRVFISQVIYLPSDACESSAAWLAENGPITAMMKVPNSFFDYSSGVYAPSMDECDAGTGEDC